MVKLDTKSMIIGFLMSTNIFMFMGLNDNKIENHTHDADEIEYANYAYYSYGTIGKAMKELKSNIEDGSIHNHDGEYSSTYHNHDGEYSSSWHMH